jgi:hypothetical protein
LAKPNEMDKTSESEKIADKTVRNEEKKKSRLRTRGPYRKAHADW